MARMEYKTVVLMKEKDLYFPSPFRVRGNYLTGEPAEETVFTFSQWEGEEQFDGMTNPIVEAVVKPSKNDPPGWIIIRYHESEESRKGYLDAKFDLGVLNTDICKHSSLFRDMSSSENRPLALTVCEVADYKGKKFSMAHRHPNVGAPQRLLICMGGQPVFGKNERVTINLPDGAGSYEVSGERASQLADELLWAIDENGKVYTSLSDLEGSEVQEFVMLDDDEMEELKGSNEPKSSPELKDFLDKRAENKDE